MAESLSSVAQARLDELLAMPLEQAALSCLTTEIVEMLPAKPTAKQIVSNISKVLNNKSPDSNLFADPTTIASISEMQNVIKEQKKDGFEWGGHRYFLTSPFDWDGAADSSRTNQYKIQSWLMLSGLLRSHYIDRTDDTLKVSRDIALDWIEQHIFGDRKDAFAWYDMGVGQRSSPLAYITEVSLKTYKSGIIHSLFRRLDNSHTILKFIVTAEIHMRELLVEEQLASHSNHGLFQMSGLLSLGSSLPICKSASDARTFSVKSIESMLQDHFFLDGFHKEHSPMYQIYIANYLHQLIQAGWLPEDSSLSNLSKNVEELSCWYVLPDGNLLPIGDSTMNYPVYSACLFELHRDGYGRPSAPEGVRIYPNGGLAIQSTYSDLGRPLEYLAFNAQFHSRQHKHADDLSLHYCVKSTQFLVDSGTFTYHYDDPDRMYVESTRAHNAVEIDGLNYSRFSQDAYGSALSMVTQVGPCTVMEGEVHHTRLVPPEIPNNQIETSEAIYLRSHTSQPGVRHRRILIHVPEHFLVVIDELKSEEPHDYIQWSHLSPKLDVHRESDGSMRVLDSKGGTHSTIHVIDGDDLPHEVLLVNGQKEPHLQGWVSEDGKVLIPNDAIGIKKHATSTAIATVFDHTKEGPKKPYFRYSTGGRYIRFAMTYRSEQLNLIIREDKEGNRTIEFSNTDETFEKIVPSGIVWEGD